MNLYYINLFDYYEELFTEKQKEYFKDYYFNNLTLQEISENNNVSRNAIHKSLNDITKKLDYYEEKLKLYKNGNKIKKIIEPLDKKIKEEIEKLI